MKSERLNSSGVIGCCFDFLLIFCDFVCWLCRKMYQTEREFSQHSHKDLFLQV